MLRKALLQGVCVAVYFTMGSGCEKGNRSFSLLSDANSFQQTAAYVPRKIDILWVIDNSGSMATSQQNVIDNFQSFIQRFQSLNFDFRMAVTTSDAYRGKFIGNDNLRRLRDGAGTNHSGVFVMNNTTTGLGNVFMINANQGITGSGDERVFSSMEDVLTYTGNADFRREDAFLAVIILSDEDDFSASTSAFLNNNYNDPRLIPVDHYYDFLQAYAGQGNVSVSAITILDNQCRDQLNTTFSGRQVGRRYLDLVSLTGGVSASLCDDFGPNLQVISDRLLEMNSSFQLTREPIPSTIHVVVDGETVLEDATNGWTYDAATLQIQFHGSSVPGAGASINISFDPTKAKN